MFILPSKRFINSNHFCRNSHTQTHTGI